MSGLQLPRRSFLGLALGASGSMFAGAPAMASLARERPMLVYDTNFPAAKRYAIASRSEFAAVHAVGGDRVRFARALVAKRPEALSGLTRYPDFLLLTGEAAEAGYRLVAQSQHAEKGGALIAWTMRRR